MGEQKKQRRSCSQQPGSSQEYQTEKGKRWRFKIYVPKYPKYPELGNRRLSRSGFLTTGKANDTLQEAFKQRRQNEKFSEKVLASYKVVRAEVSFDLAKADAYVFGDDEGKLRSPDAMTSRWARRIKWITAKHASLQRVTIKGLRHTPRDPAPRTRRAPQSRARTPRALHHHHHVEHPQPCHRGNDAEPGIGPGHGVYIWGFGC